MIGHNSGIGDYFTADALGYGDAKGFLGMGADRVHGTCATERSRVRGGCVTTVPSALRHVAGEGAEEGNEVPLLRVCEGQLLYFRI